MDFTKAEFFAYLLLYAADTDSVVSRDERNYILGKVPEGTYSRVHKVFLKDTDTERIDRIVSNVKMGNYDQATPYDLVSEIKKTMTIDGELDAVETLFLIGIRRLLRNL